MFIKNPSYISPESYSRYDHLEPVIDLFISEIPANVENIEFSEIRKYVDGLNFSDQDGELKGTDLTDEIIIEIANKKGLQYE